jgi:hypothetical protein
MKNPQQFGYYLFQKSPGPSVALKDMLRFTRTYSPGKGLQFAHVEGETSLIPHLTLWENLHVVTGGQSWSELVAGLDLDLRPLVNLIQNPDVITKKATPWERLTVSLIKATLMNAQHILVDINEELHSHINILNFKRTITVLAQKKNVYIATTNISLWMDCAHSLVKADGYEFIIEELELERLKSA